MEADARRKEKREIIARFIAQAPERLWASKTFVEGSSPSAPANEDADSRESAFFLLLSPIPHQSLVHFIKAIAIQVNVKVIGDIHISMT